MRKQFCLASTIGIAALVATWAAAQDDRSDRGSYRNDANDSRYEQRERRSYEGGRTFDNAQESRSAGRDANSQPDANDSWSEWFSDWWSDDSETAQYQSRRSGDRSARRSNRMNAGVQGFFQRHDRDDDGYLSRQELPSNLRDGFEDLDRNSDDYLSQSELREHAQKSMAQQSPVIVTYVWVLDANQGRVKLNDLQQAYDALMEVDQDGDGEITRQELNQRQQRIASRWIDKCFQQHDENNDDEISRDEAQGSQLAGRFERVDRNSDDRLTRSELRQSLQTSSRGSQLESSQSESASRGYDRSDGERR